MRRFFFATAMVMAACGATVSARAQEPFTIDSPILGCRTKIAAMASNPDSDVMPTHAIMPGCRMIPAGTRLTVVKLEGVDFLALLALGDGSKGELWTMVSWIQGWHPVKTPQTP